MSTHTSVQLTQQLGEILKEINQLRADIASLTETAATDEEHQRLLVLRSRLDSALARETRKRSEIADALTREEAAAVEARWIALEEASGVFQTKAEAVGATVELLARQSDEMLEAETVMHERARGLDVPRDWNPARFRRDLSVIVGLNLYIASGGKIAAPGGVSESPFQLAKGTWATVRGAAREFVGILFRDRRQPSAEPSAEAPPEPAQSENQPEEGRP